MLNFIIIHAYLGRDPELKEYKDRAGNTTYFTKLSAGCTRDMTDETDWFEVVIWGKRAQVVEKFFRKGSQILLWGRMESNVVEKDGVKTRYWQINGSGFDFCDSKDSPRGSATVESDSFKAAEDDIPF